MSEHTCFLVTSFWPLVLDSQLNIPFVTADIHQSPSGSVLVTLKQQVLALCVSDQHDINFFSELFDHRLHPVEGSVLLSSSFGGFRSPHSFSRQSSFHRSLVAQSVMVHSSSMTNRLFHTYTVSLPHPISQWEDTYHSLLFNDQSSHLDIFDSLFTGIPVLI